MKNGKTTGTDGLTVEFYKFFWVDIKDILFHCITKIKENNIMSREQRRAVLRLLPKKDKDITNLKNWWPISLHNTDYKLLAQTLALRIQQTLPEIMSNDQNGYVKERFIGYNIHTILDIIEHSKENKLDTIVAFLDFQKAFD